jgi:hypothetical protein
MAAGTNLDGVVRITGGGIGSRAELYDMRHILTAAHVSSGAGAQQVLFQLVRTDGVAAPIQIPILINVPAGAAFQQVPRGPTVPPALRWDPANFSVNDIALDTITDQAPEMAAPNRQMIAPYIPQVPGGYEIYATNPVGQNFTVVGYGRSGTGNDGNYSDEVQRLTLTNVPAAGGQFTLTFTTPAGVALAATEIINTNAANLQLAIARALGGRIGNTNVAVTRVGVGNAVFDVRFIGTLSSQDIPQLVANVVAGGGGFAVGVATRWHGSRTSGTKRAGMNTYDRTRPGQATMLQYDFDNGLAAKSSMGGLGLGTNNANPLTNEAFAAQGDSGGPGLILNPATNVLQIAGVKGIPAS